MKEVNVRDNLYIYNAIITDIYYSEGYPRTMLKIVADIDLGFDTWKLEEFRLIDALITDGRELETIEHLKELILNKKFLIKIIDKKMIEVYLKEDKSLGRTTIHSTLSDHLVEKGMAKKYYVTKKGEPNV